jgi:putative oxidoreductase
MRVEEMQMAKSWWTRLTTMNKLNGNLSRAIIILRVMVGSVFLSEGIQKFLFSESLGAGRFTKIGIPLPEIMAPFVGVVEIACGALLILGLVTRLASIPLIINISVAICTTKIPILIRSGFWAAVHEARTDWSMLLGLIFLLIVGPGLWSVDSSIAGPRRRVQQE